MHKLNSTIFSALTVLAILIASCKKDEPFVKPKLTIASSLTVNEADKEIKVEVTLDRAYTEDITVTYSLSGTAVDKVKASENNSSYDYEITSDYLEVVVKKGETTGAIDIKLYSDFILEEEELIEISLEKVDNENIELTREDQIKIKLVQEDGIVILLEWGIGVGESYTDVDMDLFLWAEQNAVLSLTNINSAAAGFVGPEAFFVPTAVMPDGNYGLSCNYYEGTADPMNFVISFVELVNNAAASTTKINGTYTLANINAWDVSMIDPILVQTFQKAGADFLNFSPVTVPTTGSRTISSRLPADVVKTKGATTPTSFWSLMQ